MEHRPQIKILPNYLIDQIKAGEVIDGPASLIKELLENSIDAKSTQIKIQVENNGLDLISIEDNGIGIDFYNLPLAFCRHATSKIEKFEDLYSLGTFGFRGEALASIASISRVTTFSKPIDGIGGKISFHGGNLISHISMENLEQGTSILVRDLFFNTPVRFKFIKSKISEKNTIFKNINYFIISNPEIWFSVKWDEKDKNIFIPTNWQDRVLQVLPKGEYKKFTGEYEGYQVKGFIEINSSKGNQKNHQYLFANNRPFIDRSLHGAIINSMEGVWKLSESGNYCIFLSTDPGNLDVNVHPKKTEIKFIQGSMVFSLLKSSIKNSIYKLKDQSLKKNSGLGNFLENNNNQLDYDKEEINRDPFFRLSEIYILLPLKAQYIVLNIPLLLMNFLKINLTPIEEDSQIPLLIGEPFKLENEEVRLFLKPFGFNFEKIEENKMILLSIPPYLSELPFRKIVGLLLNSLSKEEKEFDGFPFDDIKQWELKVSFSQIKHLIKPFEENLLNEDFAKVLDDKYVNSLFL